MKPLVIYKPWWPQLPTLSYLPNISRCSNTNIKVLFYLTKKHLLRSMLTALAMIFSIILWRFWILHAQGLNCLLKKKSCSCRKSRAATLWKPPLFKAKSFPLEQNEILSVLMQRWCHLGGQNPPRCNDVTVAYEQVFRVPSDCGYEPCWISQKVPFYVRKVYLFWRR